MTTTHPAPAAEPVRLADYAPPAFRASTVELLFELFEEHAVLTATTNWERGSGTGDVLELDGDGLVTEAVLLDGRDPEPEELSIEGDRLRLTPGADQFTLQIVTRLDPAGNTSLSGLYRSGGTWCTQMEAEGFRRVTWFTDRPDVMSVYTTTVVADRIRCPVLLGNGNRIDAGPADEGRHFATFHDPHPKPCYLFALVAADLASIEDGFTTRSGRAVSLHVWVDHGEEQRAAHAMESLKRAMAWDEQAFGREYDLDVFHLVAVADFNMGAMENKGLNIFNSALVLADRASATDDDHQRIEGVVGHEYFHNWSGNRVTCRDWFQLSLKEGFTVYRDQEFSADMGSRAVQRIADVRGLRELQFAEDAGPQAHPVRPQEYLAIDNFYTTTVYEKGAEVVRMLATLAGPEGFRAGTDLYFHRHDGQAVTTDHFVTAIEDATGLDLSRFRLWYDQAGTPFVRARGRLDAQAQVYELVLEQGCPPTPGQPHKRPLLIPVSMALLDAQAGHELPLRLEGEPHDDAISTQRVLWLTESRQVFRFTGVAGPVVPSLLRSFSAPVRLDDGLDDQQLRFLASCDGDLFNRWDAGQRLLTRAMLGHVAGDPGDAVPACVEALRAVLADDALDPAFAAQALDLPSEIELGSRLPVLDPHAVHAAREQLAQGVAQALRDDLLARYDALAALTEQGLDQAAAARRALKNACLELLMRLDDEAVVERAVQQQCTATSMTDELAALTQLAHGQGAARDGAVRSFRERWGHDALVLNKWFAAQAASRRPQTADDVMALTADPAFSESNPNKVRALFRTFARNPAAFHGRDGRGYRLLADLVLRLDRRNPILAGRMATLFGDPRQLEPSLAAALTAELQRLGQAELSSNTREVVARALA